MESEAGLQVIYADDKKTDKSRRPTKTGVYRSCSNSKHQNEIPFDTFVGREEGSVVSLVKCRRDEGPQSKLTRERSRCCDPP